MLQKVMHVNVKVFCLKLIPRLKLCSASDEMKALKGDARVQTLLSHCGGCSLSLPTGNPL